MLPDGGLNKFVIIDKVNLVDVTQNLRTMIPVYGSGTGLPKDIDPLCNIQRITLTKDEVANIVKYFNKISGDTFRRGDATRSGAVDVTGFLERSGGSRINYRQNYLWPNYKRVAKSDATGNVDSNGVLIVDI